MPQTNALQNDLDHILERTEGVWADLQGARLFITGGTGFFGRWLLESFIWARDRLNLDMSVVVLSRSPEQFLQKAKHLGTHSAITLCAGDVRSFDYPAGDFSHVIHAATDARASIIMDTPLVMFDTIVEGTRRVLEFATSHNTQNFLLISSGAIYGKQPSHALHLTEDYCGAPSTTDVSSVYGEGKRAAELLATIYHQTHGLGIKIARCFAFVGPFLPLDAHFAIGNFIQDGLHGRPIRVTGDGTPDRSYLYAADLAVWLWHILVRGKNCYPYNVGSQENVSIASLARTVAGAFDTPPAVEILEQAMTTTSIDRYVPSVERARRELGLTQTVWLRESIDRTLRWHNAVAKQE
jgi:nucleoside-diphosphate-sugar epimerase